MTNRPKIHVIGTGGTISGAGATATAAAYESDRVEVSDLISAVDGLDRLAEVRGETLFATGSENMGPAQWHALARRNDELPVVDITALRGGCGDRPLSYLTGAAAKGVVISGFGAGTMPDPLAAMAIELARSGTAVVVSSRVTRVTVLSKSMSPDQDARTIPSGFLNPQKSALLLSLALAAGFENPGIYELFRGFSSGSCETQ